jgi:hypothetical protein
MDTILKELQECHWPPPRHLVEEAKKLVLDGGDIKDMYYLKNCIRISERAINLSNTIHSALSAIEEAEKNLTADSYFTLIDVMHSLTRVGEGNSELYKEIYAFTQTAIYRMNYIM